jgi:hypothetical protein
MSQEYLGYDRPVAPVYVAQFSIPASKSGTPAELVGPDFHGKAPFPF